MGDKPYCPHCHIEMRVVKGKFGDFYGCTNFPKCKFISKTKVFGYKHPREFRDGPVTPGDFNTRKG